MSRARSKPDPWSRRLTEPLGDRRGVTITTLREARAYVIALPEHLQLRQHWQHAAKLLLAEEQDPAAITKQLTLAMLLDGLIRLGP